jgi:hypothetical protein
LDGEGAMGLEQRLICVSCPLVGEVGERKPENGALCGNGEMSIESFPGDDVGIGGVVTVAKHVQLALAPTKKM